MTHSPLVKAINAMNKDSGVVMFTFSDSICPIYIDVIEGWCRIGNDMGTFNDAIQHLIKHEDKIKEIV